MEQNILGKNIRKQRQKLHLTQEQLAEMLGVSTTYIGYVERGERSLTLSKLSRLAMLLGVTINELISDTPATAPAAREQQLLRLFSDATDEQQELILGMAQLITKHSSV